MAIRNYTGDNNLLNCSIQNDFAALEEAVTSVINKVSQNNNEYYHLINQCMKEIKNSKNREKSVIENDIKLEEIEDNLYEALDNILKFCIKYEKIVF